MLCNCNVSAFTSLPVKWQGSKVSPLYLAGSFPKWNLAKSISSLCDTPERQRNSAGVLMFKLWASNRSTIPPVGRLALFFSLSFFPIKYFCNHHKLYIIWKLKTSKFILWNRILCYHGNGTLKSFGGLLPLSGRCQVSYCTMHYGLLESKLFIILTKYISPERSDSQNSIFGGLFVIGVILTEKFRHLWQKNASN